MTADVRTTIAVVEDDPGVRTALRQLLRSAGFEVVAFESAEDFLAYRTSTVLGCVIADVNLPGISGAALVKQLGERENRVPAFLITGRQDAATIELARQAGDVPRLQKPFSDAALFEMIDRVMGRQE